MWRISIANLRHKPGRFIATTLAVIVGTGFLAGALVLRDSLGPALANNQSIALQNVSTIVLPNAGVDDNSGRRQATRQLQSIPADVLPKVQGANGVAGAAGINNATLKLLGPNNTVLLSSLGGQGWITVPQINPFSIVQGNPPTAAGQVAIDTDTAKQQNLAVGATIQLATTSGPKSATVVGLSNYGEKESANPQGDVLVNPADSFAYLTSGQPQYESVYAAAKAGVDQATVTKAVAQAIGSGYEVQSGSQYLQEQQDATAQFADIITTGLQAFAYVALFVAIFIIYNTFTIIVTQRTREFALLRAVGASGKQVKRALRVEAVLVGLVASALGMLVGIALFEALVHFVPQFKNIVGGDVGLRVGVSTVLQVLISGTIITFLSAVVPGWRAARTPPVAAMRTVDIDRSATSTFRMTAGTVILIAGLALLLLGAATSKAVIVGFGALVAFLSVLVGGPVLAHYFTKLAAPPARLAGEPGHLAVENVERNAKRTATTANALVIGVFLVVFVTAAGGAIRDYAVTQISKLSGADLTVQASSGATIPPQLVKQVQSTPGVQSSAVVYGEFAAAQQGFTIGAVDFAQATTAFGLKPAAGKPLTQLADNEVAVAAFPTGGGQRGGGQRGGGAPQLGDNYPITFNDGTTKQFKVASTFDLNLGVPWILMNQSAALASQPNLQPTIVGVVADPNSQQETQQALQNVVSTYSNIEVQPGNSFAQAVKGIFNFLINSVSALLGVAIVIALFGIVNTLILSIAERTREIGVLRAVGMSRRQLGTMVRIEAVVVALLGTIVGMVFGLLVAFALIRPVLESANAAMTWPFAQLGIILVLGVLLGVVASLIPAWRANRLNPIEAIRDF